MNNPVNLSTPALQNMPAELQVHIFKKLSEVDLSIMGLTCNQFNSFLENFIWENKLPKASQTQTQNLSKKTQVLNYYQSYCQYFASKYPALKEQALPTVFEQKNRTDEFLKNIFNSQIKKNHQRAIKLVSNLIDEKPELINLVANVLSDVHSPEIDTLKSYIILKSVRNCPHQSLNLIKKMNLIIKEFTPDCKMNLLTEAVRYAPSLLEFFIQQEAKPDWTALTTAAKYNPSLIPSLLKAGAVPNIWVLIAIAQHSEEYIEIISNLLLAQGVDSNLIEETLTSATA
ncbi:F-box protein [Criblamydia sequanensis]|uniref:F-box domain-containing protein n=1 Tax=Candidatus Criblamydia sequanensis CRIB-18 TaxID=1437425 RepID=A0A090D162_9BACT|nr:F-box protein [Criblamydia sequanensis]CDR35106.1 F-box domain-containing protein [Criblamydia sequanensis CRIB-18]